MENQQTPRLDRIEKNLDNLIRGIETLRESQKETDRQLGQLRESQKETDRQLRESQKETDRQLRESQENWDRRMDALRKSQEKTERGIDRLRKSQEETGRQIGELRESQKETERGIDRLRESQEKTERGIDRLRESQEKTDRGIDRLRESEENWDRRMDALRKSQEETGRQIGELRESQKETDRQLLESYAKNDEQMAITRILMEQLSKRVDDVTRQLGELGLVQGEVAEDLFYRNVKHLFLPKGKSFATVIRNLKKKGTAEYDIVASDGEDVLVIEVKNKLSARMVDSFIRKKLPNFRTVFPEYRNFRLSGGIGALVVKDEVGRYAEKSGLYVLTQTADGGAALLNRKNFKPKIF